MRANPHPHRLWRDHRGAEGAPRRRASPPFTVMSCDNLPGNGHVTQAAVVGLARLSDPALADWIAANVAFPNGMVDRITPATGPRERAHGRKPSAWRRPGAGHLRAVPAMGAGGQLPAGPPGAWRRSGVTLHPACPRLRDDEDPHPERRPCDHRLSRRADGHRVCPRGDGAPADPGLLDKVERDEIIPYVPPVPDTDLGDYYRLIVERFSNPEVADTERRLCLDGSNRQPKFIVPSIRDALAAGGSVEGLALVSALWCRYCYGETDSGTPIAPNDPDWDALVARSKAAKARPGGLAGDDGGLWRSWEGCPLCRGLRSGI